MSHWYPQPGGTSWPSVADWQDKAWLSRAVASERNSGPGGTREMEWEPSAAETPSRSALDGPGLSAEMTSPGPPGQGEGAACDAAGLARQGEQDVQPTSDGHETKQVLPVSSKWAGEADELSSLRFPEKLWKMVESDQFQSIWWSDHGRCIAINEKLFQEEVLGNGGSLRVFATQNIKSFIRQLNLYGFTKIQQDFERSASLPEFLAEEAAAAAHSQILYYYNPSFNREHPQLLERCQRRVALKRRAQHVPAMDEGRLSSSPGAQTAGDPRASPPAKRWAEAAPSPRSARPLLHRLQGPRWQQPQLCWGQGHPTAPPAPADAPVLHSEPSAAHPGEGREFQDVNSI
nr:heat shock transcription factor, X-linked-like [Columba livia]